MRRLGFKLIPFLLSVLLCAVAAEVAARAFWRQFGVPFRDPARILYAYYPELREVEKIRPSHDDKFYDILFLGGSVLNSGWGEVELALYEQLALNGRRNVRIFNLAMMAHTSRDSWLKYAALNDARFDLVIFYHGINDTRANNAPPEIFREDYAHYSWYEVVNALAPYHGKALFALPYTLRYVVIRARQVLRANQYVPTHEPREEWLQYGSSPRSAASFKQNLGAILDLAARRGDQMLLMTFASYIPADPHWGEPTLGPFRSPIRVWGRRENVLATLAIQNEVVRSLAAQQGVLFVDQASLMEGSARYFNDVCHLTVEGSLRFVENLLRVLLPHLNRNYARSYKVVQDPF
jgi:hypothetical protein